MKCIFFILIIFLGFNSAESIEMSKYEIETRLQDFKSYRFSNVSLYALKDAEAGIFKNFVKDELNKASNTNDTNSKFNKNELKLIEKYSSNGNLNAEQTIEALKNIDEETLNSYGLNERPKQDKVESIIAYLQNLTTTTSLTHPKVYIVVSNSIESFDDNIIGVIYKESDVKTISSSDKLDKFLSNLNRDENIFVKNELENLRMKDSTIYNKSAFEFIKSNLLQENYDNLTLQAKAIGKDFIYYKPAVGVTNTLINYDLSGVKNDDIQMFKRISYGEPQKYAGVNQEVLVSLDQIRWLSYPKTNMFEQIKIKVKAFDGSDSVILKSRQDVDSNGYEITVYDTVKVKKDTLVVNESNYTNTRLPEIGFELKYGAEDINMPSFTSERFTLSALWKKVKFGIILPTSGWSALQTDLFNINRKMTHAGFGIAGAFDFDFPIIPKSDVFRLNFGYSFGDPVSPAYGAKEIGDMINDNAIVNSYLMYDNRNNDYLLRFNSTLQYTFGFSIDENYLLRLGIGGSFYTMENWKYKAGFDENNIAKGSVYYKNSTELVGGLSARLDFMVQNTTTPYGASLNYFDEIVNMNLFVQFPVVDNMFYLKLKADGNVVLRETQRPWEIGSFFMPSVNLIYVF